MPLSCTKKLWRAETESEWNLEYNRYSITLGLQPTPNYHDLLLLEYGKDVFSDGKKSLLEKWLMELDEFGMMAVTTTKYISKASSLHSGYEILEY